MAQVVVPRGPETSRARSLGPLAGYAAGAMAAVAWVGTVDPSQPGHYPTCPFLFLTGWYCPGCGSLRAVHSLAHGDIAAALDRNVLTVLGAVLVVALWLRAVALQWRRLPRRSVAPPWVLYAGTVVVLAFAVARNLPFGSPLAP